MINRVKSPSIAAAEIWANPRTWVVKLPAMVFTDNLIEREQDMYIGEKESDVRDLLPDPLYIADFGLDTQLSLSAHFSSHLFHLRSKNSQLINHIIDGVHQIQHFSGNRDATNFLSQITSGNSGLAG